MPDTFSSFRRKIEKHSLQVPEPIETVSLPQQIKHNKQTQLNLIANSINHEVEYTGCSSAAHSRIAEYFWESERIVNYKETRNGLDGWHFSSRLSAWLANGSISPRQVYFELVKFESTRTKNESTYWLYCELLWREFFHCLLYKHGSLFFDKKGFKNNPIKHRFDEEKFAAWATGNTGHKIVDACMRQLMATGFISNRGRQLVASCYIHELSLDWRYAAAYFEHHLIDFDVASNYGNWQYLAGVGSDPRGSRQFNLIKQTQIYDPTQTFINKWLHDS